MCVCVCVWCLQMPTNNDLNQIIYLYNMMLDAIAHDVVICAFHLCAYALLLFELGSTCSRHTLIHIVHNDNYAACRMNLTLTLFVPNNKLVVNVVTLHINSTTARM